MATGTEEHCYPGPSALSSSSNELIALSYKAQLGSFPWERGKSGTSTEAIFWQCIPMRYAGTIPSMTATTFRSHMWAKSLRGPLCIAGPQSGRGGGACASKCMHGSFHVDVVLADVYSSDPLMHEASTHCAKWRRLVLKLDVLCCQYLPNSANGIARLLAAPFSTTYKQQLGVSLWALGPSYMGLPAFIGGPVEPKMLVLSPNDDSIPSQRHGNKFQKE